MKRGKIVWIFVGVFVFVSYGGKLWIKANIDFGCIDKLVCLFRMSKFVIMYFLAWI